MKTIGVVILIIIICELLGFHVISGLLALGLVGIIIGFVVTYIVLHILFSIFFK